MDDSLRNLLAGIVLLSAAAIAFVAGDSSDVITGDPAADPTPFPQPAAACNPGWDNVSSQSEHLKVFACVREAVNPVTGKLEKWLVVLDSNGVFQHGHQDDTPGAVFITDPALVPGWLQ